jgi:hypothetical protein
LLHRFRISPEVAREKQRRLLGQTTTEAAVPEKKIRCCLDAIAKNQVNSHDQSPMKKLLGGILAFALMSELIGIFCYGGWIRWVLVAAILFTCGLLNLVSYGLFWGKAP